MDFIVEQIEMPFIFRGPFSGIRDPICSQDDSYVSLRNYRGEKCWFWLHLCFGFLFSCLPPFTCPNSLHFGISRGPQASCHPARRNKSGREEGEGVRCWLLLHGTMHLGVCDGAQGRAAGHPGVRTPLTLWPGEQASFWGCVSPSGLTTCTSSLYMVCSSF